LEKGKLMTQSELAAFFGKVPSTVYNWEQKGMPVYRPEGGDPLYDLDEVLAWMKRGGEKKGE